MGARSFGMPVPANPETASSFDGVLPPEGLGPVQITWRQNATRRDRRQTWVAVAILYVTACGLLLFLKSGGHPDVFDVVWTVVIGGGFGGLVGVAMTSRRNYLAAGDHWLMRSCFSITHRVDCSWVRLDQLSEVRLGRRKRSATSYPTLTCADTSGRRVEFELSDLQSSVELSRFVLQALERQRSGAVIDPDVFPLLRATRPSGTTAVRSS